MESPPTLKNYEAWLRENCFNIEMNNPTNEFLTPYYGVKLL